MSDPERVHHVLVITDDLEATRDFYCDVLGFEVADKPPLPFEGVWLSLGGDACVHLAERVSYEQTLETMGLSRLEGPVDHVAFRRTDYDALAARLEEAGVETATNVVPGLFRQLYVTDPNGVRVELNFFV